MSGRKFFVAGNVKCVRHLHPARLMRIIDVFLPQSWKFGSREFYTDLVKDFNDATFPSTEVVGNPPDHPLCFL